MTRLRAIVNMSARNPADAAVESGQLRRQAEPHLGRDVLGDLAHVMAQIPQQRRVERPVERCDRRLVAPSGSFQRDFEAIRRHPRIIDTRRGKAERLLAPLTDALRAAPTTPRPR